MSRACAVWRGDVGAYLVGALDDDARARVIAHLETCAGCRSDYDELAPVRGLLSQLAGPDAAPRAGARAVLGPAAGRGTAAAVAAGTRGGPAMARGSRDSRGRRSRCGARRGRPGAVRAHLPRL
jgi:hypothetical protein